MTGTGDVVTRLSSFRQYQRGGRRAPHKPLLMLLALGRLATHGTSRLPWSRAEEELGRLIAEFGPASSTGAAQSAAYRTRRRRSGWRAEILQAWDRQCTFCGYDGQLAGVPVGLEAAHVRWHRRQVFRGRPLAA